MQPPESLGAWLTLGEKFMVQRNKDIAMHKICLYIAIIHETRRLSCRSRCHCKGWKIVQDQDR
ncbi:hypothetical protein MES4922_40270 [Mesorhizobium ventifaucium]|uniref:Uncharacterized protein n=1 Tax=Mesorhizobium ventifaucium TaxID=666020 RepID=A0ABM9E8I9_9HYPH|nr:hypothetical protein MES4922_40270 [Mesorhizobium ventifaucium]